MLMALKPIQLQWFLTTANKLKVNKLKTRPYTWTDWNVGTEFIPDQINGQTAKTFSRPESVNDLSCTSDVMVYQGSRHLRSPLKSGCTCREGVTRRIKSLSSYKPKGRQYRGISIIIQIMFLKDRLYFSSPPLCLERVCEPTILLSCVREHFQNW